tara:strand:+ start:2061 stop:2234 length:174 start_codon:yes stop_codon:yes gene_type:complete
MIYVSNFRTVEDGKKCGKSKTKNTLRKLEWLKEWNVCAKVCYRKNFRYFKEKDKNNI